MRVDFEQLSQWVAPQSRVLDLGCGDGALLRHLIDTRGIQGMGVEIDNERITACIRNGVSVIEHNLDRGLHNFLDNSFDTVIMMQALQAMRRPDLLLEEMLRVGRECIIVFPNFGHWPARLSVALGGRMPVSTALPHQWYNTPNIHLCTVKDFEALCAEKGIRILHRVVLNQHDHSGALTNLLPNLFAATAVYHVSR
ncbi:MAG: methionine biosynthesis protein MetW [Gammaproteobacteria bacterium]|nr:MAG: methionine biosynthesis protein MetW [Gammaproteobacteria bacterium]